MLTPLGKYKVLFDFLSGVNQEAYADRLLIANQVLSKNPFIGDMLYRHLNNQPAKKTSLFRVIIKLLIYYVKTLLIILLWPVKKALFYQLFRKYHPLQPAQIVIDTFFLMERINQSGSYSDPYLPTLGEVFEKQSIPYTYLPVFYGSKKLTVFCRTLKTLSKKKTSLYTEFDLLTLRHFLQLSFDTLRYPLHVLGFARRFKHSKNALEHLLYSNLLNTLEVPSFDPLSRYYQGKSLAQNTTVSQLVLWYENQVIDKLLLQGIHKSPRTIRTYGAQLLVYGPNVLNMIIDPKEVAYELLPDKILYNGSKYLQTPNEPNEAVGPSLRYQKLFSVSRTDSPDKIVAVLPLYPDDISNILNYIATLETKVLVKPHPAVAAETLLSRLPPNASLVKDDLYELFPSTALIIGAATGALIEAAAVGIPILQIKNNRGFDYTLLDEGRGEIWEEAANKEEFQRAFDILLHTEKSIIHQWSQYYKSQYFNEPTEENIIKAFDLNKE